MFRLLESNCIYLMSVVINSFSLLDASIFTPMCCDPANISHSPIPDDTSFCCSAADNHNNESSALMEVVDCFNNTWRAELDIIGFPYLLLTKSSISCDIVVIPTPYFLALLMSPYKKLADISFCRRIQASSIANNLFFLCDLTLFHMKFKTPYIAGVLSASSKSLILKTVRLLFISILV